MTGRPRKTEFFQRAAYVRHDAVNPLTHHRVQLGFGDARRVQRGFIAMFVRPDF